MVILLYSVEVKQIPTAMYYLSRFILGGLFLAITMLQTLSFPGQFRYEASNGQGSQAARWFLTIMVGLWFLLAQIAIVALWRVLAAIYHDSLHTVLGIRWLNLLVRTLGGAACYGVGVTSLSLIFTHDPAPVVVTGTLTAFISSLYIVGYFVRHQFQRQTSLL
jgi:hypothetical protein